jgi:hypothetical protein
LITDRHTRSRTTLFSQPKSSVTQHPRKWLAQIHRGQPRETMCEVSIVPILYDTRTHAAAAEASAALSQPHCLIFCRAPCFVSSSSSLNACLCSPAPHTHLVSASPLLTHTLSLLPHVSLAAHSHLVSAPQSTPCRRVTSFASHWCLHSPQATSCRSAAVLVEPFVERTTSSRAILPHACLCSPSAHTHLDKLTRNPPTRLSLLPFSPHTPCLRSPHTPRRRVTFFASHFRTLVLAFSASDWALTLCRSAAVLAEPFVERTTSSVCSCTCHFFSPHTC